MATPSMIGYGAQGTGRLAALAAVAGCSALAAVAWLLDVSGRGLPPAGNRLIALAVLLAGAAAAVGWAVGCIRRGIETPSPAAMMPLAILVLALAVRLAGLDHEATGRYYLDEGTYVHHATEINAGHPLRYSFVYPHLVYYLDAFVLWLAGHFPGATAGLARALYDLEEPAAVTWLLVRLVSATLSGATVLPVLALGRRLAGPAAGALGALLLALSPLHHQAANVHIADVPAAFFAALCLALAARLLDGERTRDYLLAGAAAGLAAGAKYPAGLVAVAIVALWLRGRFATRRFTIRSLFGGLLAAGAAAVAALVLTTPGLVLVPEAAFGGGRAVFFGARQYAQGGWLGVVPHSNALFYLQTLIESFGIAALVAGAAGLAWLRRPALARLAWLAPFPAAYLALIVAMHMVVQRNVYPALPVLAAFLGAGLAGWGAWGGGAGRAAMRPASRARRLAAVALAALCLAPLAWRTAQATVASMRPSTRDLAQAWILEHLPPGAAIAKESYTPALPRDRFAVTQVRFLPRLSPAEVRRHDYVLLASAAYTRFLDAESLEKPHHREFARRYALLFRRFPLLREWRPGALRLGPVVRLYRVPRPAPVASQEAE